MEEAEPLVTPAPLATPGSQSRRVPRGRFFTDRERDLVRRIFFVDGAPPSEFTQGMINNAGLEEEDFVKLWDRLLKAKKGDIGKARAKIRKSLGISKK